ncbi:MAG TPA: hypothetical protein VK666_21785 [Chryseolinea sp.]|nr:hypothetical protein [Chryseolinea sp.]
MAKLPPMFLGMMEGKSGKFRFPFSRTSNFQLPEFIPKEKRAGELTVAIHYALTLMNMSVPVTGVMLNDNDANGQPDVWLLRDGRKQGIQITRLTFTEFERRRAHHRKIVTDFAAVIHANTQLDFRLVVQIFPREKHRVPLSGLSKGRRTTIETTLMKFVSSAINLHKDTLRKAVMNVTIDSLGPVLSPHFHAIDFVAVPDEHFASVPGVGNIFVNYKFYDSAYDDSDVQKEVAKIYRAKNNGSAEVLIVWANEHELLDTNKIVKSLRNAFTETSFHEVYFIAFNVNGKMFPIKGSPIPGDL